MKIKNIFFKIGQVSLGISTEIMMTILIMLVILGLCWLVTKFY